MARLVSRAVAANIMLKNAKPRNSPRLESASNKRRREAEAAEAEAAPKAGLTCKATSPQADDAWCNGSCNENPDDGGCIKFCECGPASRMERLAAVPAVRSGEWTPAERARWLERHNAGSP